MLRLRADDFAARLPWFYHGMAFDPPREHDVWSIEVNGLEPMDDPQAVTLMLAGPRDAVQVSHDGLHFSQAMAYGDIVPLAPMGLSNRRLSLFVRAGSPEAPQPIEEVMIHPLADDLTQVRKAAVTELYQRDICADDSDVLARWHEAWELLTTVGGWNPNVAGGPARCRTGLWEMFAALLAWCERRQVMDEDDPHFGAVYSEEDKYDFRDAAAAAVVFTYAWCDSGDDRWLERARHARSYVYRGQHTEGERRGGWAHMVSGKWGGDHQTDFTRITQPLPPVDGVDTAIILNLLCTAIDVGLEPAEEDLRRIQMGAGWVLDSELRPGVFAHHEGATHDCQNSNALAAMALSRAHATLDAASAAPPGDWLAAAHRGLGHYVEGQEAIGVWPYRFAEIGRGQRFGEQNVPDQGMGVYHFLVAAQTLGVIDRDDVQLALRRAARWWLCTSRIDDDAPRPTIDLEYVRDGGGLLFSSFTWCRFMAAASLTRIARVTGESEPWRTLAMRLMEHVRLKLWNEDDPERAPVVASSRPDIELHSWIAAAEWEAVLLREMVAQLPS